MAHSYKTAITFGLVYVPVTLHACIKTKDIAFNTLYAKTGERIRYEKTCENCPEEVDPKDIIKGYQYEKDKYVTITDEELEKIKTKKDRAIEIESFVNLEEIDPVYFDKSYFINPTSAENAYLLILKSLEEQNKVGIAKTVLGTKEQVVAIRAIQGQMILNTMHFYDEIQVSPVKNIPDKISAKELSLAKMIIENMTESFEPEKYKDEYRARLYKAIQTKLKGKPIQGKREDIVASNITNLMDALQQSVKKPPKKSTAKSTTKKKKNIIPFAKRA